MANYSDIKGFTVQTLSSDTAASQIATGSWASTTSLNTARHSLRGAGTQTQSIMFGGDAGAPSVSNAKNMTNSNGLFTGFLNLIIESAPIIPRDKAISSLIIDVIIYPMPGSNKQVAR